MDQQINVDLILEKIENLSQNFKNHTAENKNSNNLILEQVKRTNGRVTQLEKWRYLITGGLLLLSIIVSFIATKVTIGFVS